MTRIERSTVIAHSAAAVWARLADFGAISSWADNVDHSCLLRRSGEDPSAGVGAVRRVQVGRRALTERVVTCDEPRTLAYAIEGLPPVAKHVTNEWRLEPIGTGSAGPGSEGAATTGPFQCRVTLVTTVDCGHRPPQKLVANLLARRLAKDSDTMLAGLVDSMKEPSHV